MFCGNGLNGNPDPRVIDFVFNSRRGPAADRALAAPAGEPFHFWFSTTAAAQPEDSARRVAFAELEEHVEALRQSSQGQLIVHFNDAASVTLEI